MSTTAPERLRRPAQLRSLQLGELKISYVPDGAVRLPATKWLPDTTEQTWVDNPEYVDEATNLVAGIGGLLVERNDRALLIDAGFGPDSVPAQPGNAHGAIYGGALLDNISALGRSPADIEAVAFTHLHVDHVGWAWSDDPTTSKPPFTAAEYLICEPEWTHRQLLEQHGTSAEICRALEPQVRTVADGAEIFPGVRVMLTAGHTPGHTAYLITSGSQRLIAFGDALHSPIQVEHPDWSAAPDHDRTAAVQHRRRLIDLLAEPDTIGFGIHFADMTFGRVHRSSGQRVWQPVA